MKKFILVVFLLSFSIVSAEYYSGETVQLYFDEDVSSMSLYCNGEEVSFSPLLNDYNNGKMVYFDLNSEINGSCTFFYSLGNKTFDVLRSDNILRVKPAIVLLGSKDSFSLELTDVNGSYNVGIVSNNELVVPRKISVDLEKGESVNVYFDYETFVGESLITLSYDNRSYEIIVVGKDEVLENETIEVVNETKLENGTLVFLVTKDVEVQLHQNESVSGELKVQNLYSFSIENLEYSVGGDLRNIVSFENETIWSLASKEIFSNLVYFNRENNSEVGNYSGSIILSNGEYSVELPVIVKIVGFEDESQSTYTVFNQTVIGVDEGQIYSQESKGKGVYFIGIVLIILLIGLIVLVVLKLRQKEDKQFDQYISETKNKK